MTDIKHEYFGDETRQTHEFQNLETQVTREYFGGAKVEAAEWSTTKAPVVVLPLTLVTDLPAGPLAYGAADSAIPSVVWSGGTGEIHIEVADSGTDIVDDVTLPAGSTSYKLTGYNDWHADSYIVTVIDSLAPTPGEFNSSPIEIGSLPSIKKAPASLKLNEGGTGTMTVEINESGPQVTYQWKKGTADVVDGANFSGAKTKTLTFSNVPTNAAGTYKCVVTNTKGSKDSGNAILTVDAVPPIVFSQDYPATYSLAAAAPVLKWSGGIAPYGVTLENGMASVDTATVQDGTVGFTLDKTKLTAGMSLVAVVRGDNGTGTEFRSATMAVTA